MSYELKMLKSQPSAMWLMDDTAPFDEHTGSKFAGVLASGSSNPTSSPPLVAGALYGAGMSNTRMGQFTSPVFKLGQETQFFALEAWVLVSPQATDGSATGIQQILSHNGIYDGLTIEGNILRFSTQYSTAGSATCQYDLRVNRAVHAVGIHTERHNQLWVNGEMVSQVELTEDQQVDDYVFTDNALYCGGCAVGQKIIVNGLAVYADINADIIKYNYEAGRDTVPQNSVPSQFNGTLIALDSNKGSKYIDQTWAQRSDFANGYASNVSVTDEQVVATADTNGLTVSGYWVGSIILDVGAVASTYGASIDWSGKNITVETRVTGGAWTVATNGQLITAITQGYITTNKMLEVRATMTSGVAQGEAYLDSLRVRAFRDNSIVTSENRAVTLTRPAVLREDYEPIEYRDDNGLNLSPNGKITIGADTSADPNTFRTIEIWLRAIATPNLTTTGLGTVTRYTNGVAQNTYTTGDWMLIHWTSATDFAGAISLAGNVIIGQIALYPTTLTATEIAHIYRSYTGRQVTRITEPGVLSITEPASPIKIYSHDWAVDGAG